MMNNEYTYVILNLLAVLGIMLLVLFLLKKFKFAKMSGSKLIKVLNAVPIGHKEKLLLIEVNNTVLLVGATSNHIETLYVFNELDKIENMSTGNFSEQLNAIKQLQ